MQQIANLLKSLGLEQYMHCFTENDIDFSILRDLTEQDLEKIGIQSLGHRRRLLRAIADPKTSRRAHPRSPVRRRLPRRPGWMLPSGARSR